MFPLHWFRMSTDPAIGPERKLKQGPDRLTNLLGATASAVMERVGASIEVTGLGSREAALLNAIGQHRGQRIADIRLVLGLSHPGAVRAVDRLVEAELVQRLAGTDGRSVGLDLTDAGEVMWHKTRAATWSILTQAMTVVASDERVVLERVLENVLGVLTVNPAQAEFICRLCDESRCPQDRCPVTQAAAQPSASLDE
jgi:MarR family transcriptional regulator, negative regulator of the multidrug operon emrRAB